MKNTSKLQQIEIVTECVELAIRQAAEISGLRNWFIWQILRRLPEGERPHEEMLVQYVGSGLEDAFYHLVDPDDDDFHNCPIGGRKEVGCEVFIQPAKKLHAAIEKHNEYVGPFKSSGL